MVTIMIIKNGRWVVEVGVEKKEKKTQNNEEKGKKNLQGKK